MMIFLSDADLIWKLQQENAKLRNTVAFYARPNNYSAGFGFYSGIRKISQVDYDGGQRARKVLEEINSGFNHGKHAAGE
jgi:hypothetical protein